MSDLIDRIRRRIFTSSDDEPDAKGGAGNHPGQDKIAPMPTDASGSELLAVPGSQHTRHKDPLAEYLTGLANDGLKNMIGKVQVLRLDKLQEKLGDNLDRFKDNIDTMVRNTINAHLEASDMVVPYGSTSYLLVFANLSDRDSELKCALIRDEICEHILGMTDESYLIEVAMVHRNEAGEIEFIPVRETRELAAAIADDAVVKNDDAAAGARQVIELDSDHNTPHGAPPLDAEGAHAVHDPLWKVIAATGKKFAGEIVSKQLLDLDFVLQPIWTSDSRAFEAYVLIPARAMSDGSVRLGADAHADTGEGDSNFGVDLAGLQKTRQSLAVLPDTAPPPILVCPVHFENLLQQGRREVIYAQCEAMPLKGRHLLRFEIVGTPASADIIRLAEFIGTLGEYGGGVWVNFIDLPVNDHNLKATGMQAIGLHLNRRIRNETQMIEAVRKFSELAEEEALTSYVRGFPSSNIVTAAVGFGVNMLGGGYLRRPALQSRSHPALVFNQLVGAQEFNVAKN